VSSEKPILSAVRCPILYFSRGFGRGHAIKDMTIVRELGELRPDLKVKFVSYGTGARTFKQNNQSLIDLNLNDTNPYLETLVEAASLIRETSPRLVVSHDEFAALPAAKTLQLPALFITRWFYDSADLKARSLQFADEVIFIEEKGVFEEPAFLKGKVSYVGPVLREFTYSKRDRIKARAELGLPVDSTVISVLAGGAWPEKFSPIFDLVLAAFDYLGFANKWMVWIAAEDFQMLSARLRTRANVLLKEAEPQIDRVMVASDLAITKGTYSLTKELAHLGIPSISLSYGLEPLDERFAESLSTNKALKARTTDANGLAECMNEMLGSSCSKSAFQVAEQGGARRVAQILSNRAGIC